MYYKFFSRFTSLMLALVITFAGFTPALAAPPDNDNFDLAYKITSLPFTSTVDITEATNESNEPAICALLAKSVWYYFTAAETMLVTSYIQENIGFSIMNVYQGNGGGIDNLSFMTCQGNNTPYTFLAVAGQTYYLQVGTISGFDGTIQVNLDQVPAPPNDQFAGAINIGVAPVLTNFDIGGATLEDGEPTPSCLFGSPFFESVWYAFSPSENTSLWATLSPASFSPVMAVYSGAGFNDLTELGCGGSNQTITFQAAIGQTYYFQIGSFFPELGSGSFRLEPTQPPVAGMFFSPSGPSVFDTIQFYDQSNDPGQMGFQSFTWEFGDGSTSTDQYPTHKYESDGDYTVQHSVTTTDGRTASTSQVIQVRTHDVTITKVEAPESSKVGRNVKINVSVNNPTAYSEMVRIELYRSIPGGGFELVDAITQAVPAFQKGDKTTKYSFHYTFTSGDAAVGKVIFRAVATIENASDAFPQDNERLSSLTIVKKK